MGQSGVEFSASPSFSSRFGYVANTVFPASIVTLWIVKVKDDANEGSEYPVHICAYLE